MVDATEEPGTERVAIERTATDRIYDAIYRGILEQSLAPGMRLREVELAVEFDVSRTVVRQALQRLAQNRLVQLHHNRGAQVTEPTRALAAQVFDARCVVECAIARRLGARLTGEQHAALRDVVAREAEADSRGDRPAAVRLSGEFHRLLAQMSGNDVFVRLIDELLPTTSLLVSMYEPSGARACAAHRHEDVLSALQRGGAAAAGEMRRHLREIERSLRIGAFAAYREALPE